MKTRISRWNLRSAALFLFVIRPKIYLKTNPVSRVIGQSRALRTLLLCGAAALWAVSGTAHAQVPQLGNYADTSVSLSGDTTVTPDATPANTTSINVSTDTNFKGTFAASPTTGVVTVTDAHPGGTYTVTVTAFGPGGTTTKTFTLTVTSTPCGEGFTDGFTNAADVSAGSRPRSVAIGDFNGDGKQDLAVANNGVRHGLDPPGRWLGRL